jgi:polygalacturonase
MMRWLLLTSALFTAVSSVAFRPEDFGCVPDGRSLCTTGIRKAFASCPASGCVVEFAGPGTYLTQAFNLTSNLELRIGADATILATSEDRYNLDHAGGDWPVLPWAEYPSLPTRDINPAAHAVVRGYNLTNVSIVSQPGGMLDCGGTYWICQAWGDAKKADGFCGDPSKPGSHCLHPPCNASCMSPGHKPGPCPPGTPTRPRCLHLIGTDHIRITNLTMRNSPFWNLHFQFSSDIVVDGVQIYQFPSAANADGIDVDSSKNVVVRRTMVDSNDDMLCVKSGANWLGRHAGVPSENILFEDCEIRSGHGLTLGSEMSGGVRNVTYRNIFYNASASCANADPHDCGGAKPHSNPGGAHFKTQRGRGGYLIDIMVSHPPFR